MKHIVDYLDAGKPATWRTATHAFALESATYARFSHDSKEKGWGGRFRKQVLGDTWINHHGHHGQQSTLGLIAKDATDNPIRRRHQGRGHLGPTDVYGVRPLDSSCKVLLLGEVLTGMKPTDKPVEGKKNDPMMPLAWTKTYQLPDGKEGKSFTTTMGASQDLESEGMRRLLVNACYWAVGLADKIPEKANVEIVGEYKPSPFKGGGHVKGVKPSDLAATLFLKRCSAPLGSFWLRHRGQKIQRCRAPHSKRP